MRKQSIALLVAIALGTLGGSVAAHAQAPTTSHNRKTFGFQDSRTGVFHPLGHSEDLQAEVAAVTTTYSGTIEVTVTATLKTALPKGDAVACNVDAIATSVNETNPLLDVTYDDSATAIATVAGSTATCKVSIPFSWLLLTPSATVINSLDGSLSVFMYSPTATTITTLFADFVREHIQAITINKGVPGDGTLAVAVAVTI
jgi:hypothetical protein